MLNDDLVLRLIVWQGRFVSRITDGTVPPQTPLEHPEQHRDVLVDVVINAKLCLLGVEAMQAPRVLDQRALPRYGERKEKGVQAHIVEPGADNDGDGETNGDELKNGTNPFEAQSSSAVSMRILGPQFVGQTFEVRLDRLTTLPAPFLLFLGARAKVPIAAPGVFKGLLHVDLATVLPVVAGIVSPAQPFTLKVPVPNDTNLAGLAVMMQAVLQDATSKPTLRMSDPEPFVIQR